MKKTIKLLALVSLLVLVGYTTRVIIEQEKIIEPVYIEKTVTNVSLRYFSINCWDEIDTLDINYTYFLDVENEYITDYIEEEWLKKEIRYPFIRFNLYGEGETHGDMECRCHGKVKIDIRSSDKQDYSQECFYHSEDNKVQIIDCEYLFEQAVMDCLREIE